VTGRSKIAPTKRLPLRQPFFVVKSRLQDDLAGDLAEERRGVDFVVIDVHERGVIAAYAGNDLVEDEAALAADLDLDVLLVLDAEFGGVLGR